MQLKMGKGKKWSDSYVFKQYLVARRDEEKNQENNFTQKKDKKIL